MEVLLGEAPPRERVEDALIEEFVSEFAFDRAEEHRTPDDLPPDLLGG
jgi:hypothetical protein